MPCLDEDTSLALVNGELDPAKEEEYFAHAVDCVTCRDLLAHLHELGTGPLADADSDESSDEARSRGPVPTTIGGFQIIRKLGAGGMGMVFLARDRALDRLLAVKLVRKSRNSAALLHEARAMAQLRHPNVVTIYEVGQETERDVFVAMEYVEGRNFRSHLATGAPWQTSLRHLLDAGRGLEAAHAQGILHQDFKPENIMLGDDGRVLVVDFGLVSSPHTDDEAPINLLATAAHIKVQDGGTRSIVAAGTPAYMAPELFSKVSVSPESDQFAFCVVAYEVLYGTRPFHGTTVQEFYRAAEKGPPQPANGPRELSKLVLQGLAPDPADRHPSLSELLRKLESALEASERPLRKTRWLAAGAAFAAIALGVYSFAPRTSAPRQENSEAPRQDWENSELPEVQEMALEDDPFGVSVRRLSNGLTVYFSPDHSSPHIHARLVVRAGSENHSDDVQGLASLVAKSVASGSKRLGTADVAEETARLAELEELYDKRAEAGPSELPALEEQIAKARAAAASLAIPSDLDDLWDELDVRASVAVDFPSTYFSYDLPSNRLSAWAIVMASQVAEPSFRLLGHRVEAMLGAVQQRLAADPRERTMNAIYQQVLGRPYSLPQKDNPRITPQALREFHSTWYRPNNAALILSGDVDPTIAMGVLEQALASWKPADLPERPHVPLPEQSGEIQIAGAEEHGVYLVWPTVPYGHEDAMALSLLSDLITTRLSRESPVMVRGRSFVVSKSGPGIFVATATTRDPTVAETLPDIVKAEVARLTQEPVTQERFDAVYASADTDWHQVKDSRFGRTSMIYNAYLRGDQWASLVGRPTIPPEVSPESLLATAKKYLTEPVLVRVSPGQAAPTEVPPKTPLAFSDQGQGDFAQSVLEMDAVLVRPQTVYEDTDYKRSAIASGWLIEVENTKSDLFELALRYPLGYGTVPLACAALRIVERESRLAFDALGTSLSIRCGAIEVEVRIRGAHKMLASSWELLARELRGEGITPELWESYSKLFAESPPSGSGRDVLADLIYYAMYPSLRGRSWTPEPGHTWRDAKEALASLSHSQHTTRYFGRSEANLAAMVSLPAQELPPVRHVVPDEETSNLWVASDAGLHPQVGILVMLPALSMPEQVALELLVASLSGESGAFRRAHSGTLPKMDISWGLRPSPRAAGALWIRFSESPEQLATTLPRILGVLRDVPLTASTLEAAQRRLAHDYRTNWLVPMQIPGVVDRWSQLGFDADPRASKVRRIAQVQESELAKAQERLRGPLQICITGSFAPDALKALGELGELHRVTLSDLPSERVF